MPLIGRSLHNNYMAGSSSLFGDGFEVFSHHLRALLVRAHIDDLEAIGASLKRLGINRATLDDARTKDRAWQRSRTKRPSPSHGIDFHLASPLSSRPRQSAESRIPHFSITRVTATYSAVKGTNGLWHLARVGDGTASAHFDYVTEGTELTFGKHVDYIRRINALDRGDDSGICDVLDAAADVAEHNANAIISNIKGGRERQRSLFEAAERLEHIDRRPNEFDMYMSTEWTEEIERLVRNNLQPNDKTLREIAKKLRLEHDKLLKKEGRSKAGQHRQVKVARLPKATAETYLNLFRRSFGDMVQFKPARSGRSALRLVAELPSGLNALQRREVVEAFCNKLNAKGMMYVAAIHAPDSHSNVRNHHVHVDCYERTSAWLPEAGCWDFEYQVRVNGKLKRPLLQSKVRLSAEAGEAGRVNDATILRHMFIDSANMVMKRLKRPGYLKGTYKDNSVHKTPLAHMGSKSSAAERQGRATAVGSRNARIIVNDELEASFRKYAADCELSGQEFKDVFPTVPFDRCRRFIQCSGSLPIRLFRAEAFEIIARMARSRAETVLKHLAIKGATNALTATEVEAKRDAQDHLRWVDENSPTRRELELEAFQVRQMQAEIAATRAMSCRPQETWRRDNLYYEARSQDRKRATPAHPAYEGRMRARLVSWIDQRGSDAEALKVNHTGVSLSPQVPAAIDTLFQRFIEHEEVQAALKRALARRKAREVRIVAAEPVINAVAPSPADVGNDMTPPTINEQIVNSPIYPSPPRPDEFTEANVLSADREKVSWRNEASEKSIIKERTNERSDQPNHSAGSIGRSVFGEAGCADDDAPLPESSRRKAPVRRGFVAPSGVRILPHVMLDGEWRTGGSLLQRDRGVDDRGRPQPQDHQVRRTDSRGEDIARQAEGGGSAEAGSVNPADTVKAADNMLEPDGDDYLLQLQLQQLRGLGR